MRKILQSIFTVLALLLLFLLPACGNATPAPAAPALSASPPPTTEDVTGVELDADPEQPVEDPEFALPDISQVSFDNPTEITNQWFPLSPGTMQIYDGLTDEGGRKIPHRIEYYVTDLVKEIAGVQTVVVYILDYSDEQLVEAEIAFYAQADDGTVWFMGEYPEVYEDGKMVEAPAWIPGIRGAQAGIVMQADPQVGLPSYAQGWGPAVNWTDRGHVVAAGEQTCVPVNCYENVLVIEEFSQSEPDAFQVKSYAAGVGNVRVGWRGEDASREELALVEFRQLTPEEMAQVREKALDLEASAYKTSKEVYDQTKPSEPRSP